MNASQIRSIGFLHCADGSINLTPVFEGHQQPTFTNISADDFKALGGDIYSMKQAAINILNSNV